LTGGPCGGKTTAQARLTNFFENLGWKVYRCPETATVLLSGGVNFTELPQHAAEEFQADILRTQLQIENTFFSLAEASDRNCLVICDRGVMDSSIFLTRQQWENVLARNNLDEVEIRDSRYNQVIHMVTAAKGAEEFYTIDKSVSIRDEGLELARERDTRLAEAWLGHPYVDMVENSEGGNFELKVNTLIAKVAWSMGLDVGDRLKLDAKKVKFVVNSGGQRPAAAKVNNKGQLQPPLLMQGQWPSTLTFCDFDVCHHYLSTAASKNIQSRVRKRGRNGKWSYTHTIRKQVSGQVVEVKTPISDEQYSTLLTQSDPNHFGVWKTRRCFMWKNQYFQLDAYLQPSHPRCKGLMFLETYTPLSGQELRDRMPPFLNLGPEVTGDCAFSMFNLSLKDDWISNEGFCHNLSSAKDDDTNNNDMKTDKNDSKTRAEALNRLQANKSKTT